jgi:Fe-S-cluster containining protein
MDGKRYPTGQLCTLTQEVTVMATVLAPIKPRREQVPKDKVLCEYCTAKCCRYFALPFDTPTELADYEFIRWFLLHERATVFKEGKDWDLLVHTQCRHLQEDNRSGIYDTRPQVCRDYSTKDCEYEDDWTYDFYLERPEQVAEYTEAVLQEKGRSIRSKKPPLLPIIS